MDIELQTAIENIRKAKLNPDDIKTKEDEINYKLREMILKRYDEKTRKGRIHLDDDEHSDSNKIVKQVKIKELLNKIKDYRKSEVYKELLHTFIRHKQLSPYNAYLVNEQKPHAMYVLREEEWKEKFGRGILPNAQKIVILTFEPTNFVYDISDTYPLPNEAVKPDILEILAHPQKSISDVSTTQIENLMKVCAYDGVSFDNTFNAGSSYRGYIRNVDINKQYKENISVTISPNYSFNYEAPFLISVNKNASNGERFGIIIHELGHLFCFHQPSPLTWNKWVHRNIGRNAKEFEAESVAWLVCNRLGIDRWSGKYLTGYTNSNSDIPDGVSLDHVCYAYNKIWKMINSNSKTKYENGWAYKYDTSFRKQVNLYKQILEKEEDEKWRKELLNLEMQLLRP